MGVVKPVVVLIRDEGVIMVFTHSIFYDIGVFFVCVRFLIMENIFKRTGKIFFSFSFLLPFHSLSWV